MSAKIEYPNARVQSWKKLNKPQKPKPNLQWHIGMCHNMSVLLKNSSIAVLVGAKAHHSIYKAKRVPREQTFAERNSSVHFLFTNSTLSQAHITCAWTSLMDLHIFTWVMKRNKKNGWVAHGLCIC